MPNPLRNLQMPGGGRRPQPRARYGTTPRRYEPSRGDGGRANRPRRPVPGWIGVAVGGVVALGALGWGTSAVLASDWFSVHAVEVHGAQITSTEQIAAASGLVGQSMLTFDRDRAMTAVRELPAVKDVAVKRLWLHRIRLDVTEHQAWGYWQSGGHRLVVDADGQTLQAFRPAEGNAPTIVETGGTGGEVRADADTVRLVARLTSDGTLDRAHVQPKGYLFRRDRGLTVIADGQPDVIFGDSSNYDFKTQTWVALTERLRAQPPADRVNEIDLRFGRNVVLRSPNGGATPAPTATPTSTATPTPTRSAPNAPPNPGGAGNGTGGTTSSGSTASGAAAGGGR